MSPDQALGQSWLVLATERGSLLFVMTAVATHTLQDSCENQMQEWLGRCTLDSEG